MSKNKQSRRQARALAFQVLYGINFSPVQDIEELMATYNESPDVADKGPAAGEPEGFSWELIKGVWTSADELDEAIGSFSKHWRIDRIGKIEVTLLRLAMYEMLYRADVPPKVAINEAIELTKQFGDEKSRSFINGILDAAAKALDSGELVSRV